MFALAENPRTAIGGSANHHGIYTIAVETLGSPLGGGHIAVADNGNMDCGVVLDLTNQSPVGIAAIHLRTGATVNSESLNTNILQAQGNLLDILVFVVPTEAGFDRYGELYGLHDLAGHLHHQGHVFHHTATPIS